MYLRNSPSVALATAPTAISASSWTVVFFPRRRAGGRPPSSGRSAAPLSRPIRVATCSVPDSRPCSSIWLSRSSFDTIWSEKVASRRVMMMGNRWRIASFVSSAELVTVVFSASYADVRRFCVAASARSVHESSACAIAMNCVDSGFDGRSRWSSQCSAKLWIARQTLAATRGWSSSPLHSTPRVAGPRPPPACASSPSSAAADPLHLMVADPTDRPRRRVADGDRRVAHRADEVIHPLRDVVADRLVRRALEDLRGGGGEGGAVAGGGGGVGG